MALRFKSRKKQTQILNSKFSTTVIAAEESDPNAIEHVGTFKIPSLTAPLKEWHDLFDRIAITQRWGVEPHHNPDASQLWWAKGKAALNNPRLRWVGDSTRELGGYFTEHHFNKKTGEVERNSPIKRKFPTFTSYLQTPDREEMLQGSGLKPLLENPPGDDTITDHFITDRETGNTFSLKTLARGVRQLYLPEAGNVDRGRSDGSGEVIPDSEIPDPHSGTSWIPKGCTWSREELRGHEPVYNIRNPEDPRYHQDLEGVGFYSPRADDANQQRDYVWTNENGQKRSYQAWLRHADGLCHDHNADIIYSHTSVDPTTASKKQMSDAIRSLTGSTDALTGTKIPGVRKDASLVDRIIGLGRRTRGIEHIPYVHSLPGLSKQKINTPRGVEDLEGFFQDYLHHRRLQETGASASEFYPSVRDLDETGMNGYLSRLTGGRYTNSQEYERDDRPNFPIDMDAQGRILPVRRSFTEEPHKDTVVTRSLDELFGNYVHARDHGHDLSSPLPRSTVVNVNNELSRASTTGGKYYSTGGTDTSDVAVKGLPIIISRRGETAGEARHDYNTSNPSWVTDNPLHSCPLDVFAKCRKCGQLTRKSKLNPETGEHWPSLLPECAEGFFGIGNL